MSARVAIALAFFAAVACKRHQEAAPSSMTTAPLSSSGVAVEPAGGVPTAALSVANGSADAGEDEHDGGGRKPQEYGVLRVLGGDGGAIGDLFGELDGGAFAVGGLGLGGTGSTGLGTIGRGSASGAGLGRLGRGSSARLSLGTLTVNGRLPPEVIRRIIRRSFGRFRLCYEDGLRSNPMLQGRVTTKFVIASDGSVSSAKDGGSDLPDQSVIQCIVRGYSNIAYPQPEGGIVVVSAPILFSPGT